MDDRPIAVFDSGIGGLSCVAPLRALLPGESIIFFGDTARVPYGSRSDSTIISYSLQAVSFLEEAGAKAVVIACNTISAVALQALREAFPRMPLIGIIDPAARKAAEYIKNGRRVGLIATAATVRNGAYIKAVRRLIPDAELPSRACPLFVPIAEEGLAQSEVAVAAARHYLESFARENELDALLLGCTHYPFLESSIRAVCPDIELIDPAGCLAQAAEEELKAHGLLAPGGPDNKRRDLFYASALTDSFRTALRSAAGGDDYDIVQKFFNG